MKSAKYLYVVAFASKRPGYLCVNHVEESRDSAQDKAFGFGRTGFVLPYLANEAPVIGQYLSVELLEAAGLF